MKAITLLYILSAVFVVTACNKDKFNTTPLIEIKEYNSREIHNPPSGFSSRLVISLNYFDKEGDLGKGIFYAQRVRLNSKPLGSSDLARAYEWTRILPDFTNRDKGEIIFQLDYANDLKESRSENDTLQFRFAVTDRAGNVSDTIISDRIIVLQ